MQVSLEQPGGLERRLKIEVPEQHIADQVRSRLQSVARNARIDGFRPGKAPARVIERQFGPRVRGEVITEVVRTAFVEAVTSHQLRPVADPVIEPLATDEGQGLSFTATFEVFPEITLAPFEELDIEKPECDVTDADLDKMIQVLRDQSREFKEASRPAADGDRLQMDFEGTMEGEESPFENGSAKDFNLILGQGRMIPGFEEGLTGASAGDERTLNLKFPEDYHQSELAGRGVTFKVKVNKVEEPVLPELDDAFFARFGVEEGGLEKFRAEVRANMERERDRALARRFNEQVLERLREQNSLELPRALVRSEALRMLQEMRRTLAMRGMDPSQFGGGEDAAGFEGPASNRVKLGLIMAEVIKLAGIKPQPAKVRERVEALAASYEQPEALVKWYYEEPGRLSDIEGLCMEEDAVAFIIEKARVKPVSLSFDDLMNPRQTPAESASGEA
ncbi:MAG: trigger factor [Gammaproteobacteria bacterium]|nr:trigger factor [Gammaproteobacteria bacterium]